MSGHLPPGQPQLLRAPAFRTTAQQGPDGTVLAVHGELDLATSPRLEAALSAHLRGRPAVLTVDLSAVSFIDCSGLNALLRAQARARPCRTALRLDPVSAQVSRLLALVGALPRPAAPLAHHSPKELLS